MSALIVPQELDAHYSTLVVEPALAVIRNLLLQDHPTNVGAYISLTLNIILESLLKSKLRLPRTAGLPPLPQINPLQQLLLQQTLLLLSLSLFLPYPLHPPQL